MRTVTFIGLLTIGGALRNLADMGSMEYYTPFFAVILICSAFMDVAEFIKKMDKK